MLKQLEPKKHEMKYTVARVYYSENYTLAHNGREWRILLNHDVVCTQSHPHFEEIRDALEFKPFFTTDTDDFQDGAEWQEKTLFNQWYLQTIECENEDVPDFEVLGYFSEFAEFYAGESRRRYLHGVQELKSW